MTFLNLGENNEKTLFNFLQEALLKNNEFEIRFGKFIFERNDNSGGKNNVRFDSNINIDSFYSLKQMMEKNQFQKKIIVTREHLYQHQQAIIKKIVNVDTQETIVMLKQCIKKYDIYDYNMRFSNSYEKVGVELPQEDRHRGATPPLTRTKNRTSFALPFGTLDLTVVEQEQKGIITTKYEVECEITNGITNGIISKLQKKEILDYLLIFLQIIQNNYYIISSTEKRNVLTEYRNLVKNKFFIGAQPETLHKERISTLYKNEYSVTDKADGERFFMFIDKNKNVYFIDSNLNNVLKTNVKCNNFISSVIDGELLRHDNVIHFLAFDLLFYNDTDLRGNNNYLLKTRLGLLKEINLTISDFYKISIKHYYFGNVFSASKTILENIDNNFYKNDGLIFTPINEPYPLAKKWRSLLKWKPSNMNTIDFYIVKKGSIWELYVQGGVGVSNDVKGNNFDGKNDTKILFDINKFNEKITNVITYETTFDPDTIDNTTGEKFKTNTVVEFYWDQTRSSFQPIRTRWDKTMNERKHGNYIDVACDIWNTINNPIDKEFLLKFNSSGSGDNDPFEKMRKFHNKIKENLYSKHAKKNTLLELCSGRGGDLNKWLYNSIKIVDGYDISDKNILECKKRFTNLKKNNDLDYNFYKLDLGLNDSYKTIYKNNPIKYDTVCCQFGLHYFFKSEQNVDNILKILASSLKENGLFIITFMDNTKLNELFNEKDIVNYTENDEIIYILERENQNVVPYGNKLQITLVGNNILSQGSNEWIIDYQVFLEKMKFNGFTCIETELFENIYSDNLNFAQYEKDISFLNRYAIFKKTKIAPKIENVFENSYSHFNFASIDLHQKNISVLKINSLRDIIDTINCIEYSYLLNDNVNVELSDPETTIELIQKMFSDLNIIYNCVFIKDPLDFSEYLPDKFNIYFTWHKHSIEKKEESELITIDFNNWYIILHNDRILFKQPQEETLRDLPSEIVQETLQESVQESVQETVQETVQENDVYNKMTTAKTNGKLTMKIMKDILKEAGLKVSGKKEELEQRLEQLSKC